MADGTGSTFANQLLQLIFNAVTIASLAENASTSPLANLYVSLHTADPTVGGNQTTNEISYTGYARVAVVRTSAGWVVTGNQVFPAANIQFGTMTGGTGGTVAYWAVGTALTGAGEVLYVGAVAPTIPVVNGAPPCLTTASSITQN